MTSHAVELLGPSGPIAQAFDGYELRESQLRMAQAVEDTLRYGGVSLIEAGTGTGKTFAYLIPAILSGKTVVISTGTKALQDQLAQGDIPALRRALKDTTIPQFKTAVMKGLSNYLCLRRLKEFSFTPSSMVAPFSHQLPILEDFRQTTQTGDRSELEALPENADIWREVLSSMDTRIGAKCAHHDACFVTAMRRRAAKAAIIVVNHHLFFADLALRNLAGLESARVLPDYDAVIFDEAHRIEDVATQFFGTSVSSARVHRLVKDAENALARNGANNDLAERLSIAADAFFLELPDARGGEVVMERGDFTGELETRYFRLEDAAEALRAHASSRSSPDSLRQIGVRASRLIDDLSRLVDGASGDAVASIEETPKSTVLRLRPITVDSALRSALFDRVDSVVMTSATMTSATNSNATNSSATGALEATLGHTSQSHHHGLSFDYFCGRVGIDFEVESHALPSPFDFSQQAALYLPSLPDPRAPRFAELATDEILQLIDVTGGGAFVLCTSRRMMHTFAQLARPELVENGHRVLVQGQGPKDAMLARFREDKSAVLFATASFWEGIDVPGEALRLVIIDRIPFMVPTDPLVAARSAALEDAGQNPFMDYLVPEAALSLKQGFGRLIRSRQDHGIVALLDSRILKKRYGSVLLDSLPPATRCYDIDEARACWATMVGERALI